MNNERVVGGTSLGGKNFGDSISIGSISAESINRFGRESNELAGR